MRGGDWIQTFTGRQFYPLDPRLEEIAIEDIAHALAHTCRFTGHTREFYSVAQHCVLASGLCDGEARLWALLHDASEAYLCDVARPVKHAPVMTPYRELEDQLQTLIYQRFGLVGPVPAVVKHVDRVLLATEKRDLMPHRANWSSVDPALAAPWTICPQAPRVAEQAFLARFTGLWGTSAGQEAIAR